MGQKSIFEDLSGMLDKKVDTTLTVTGGIESSSAPVCRGSGRGGGRKELCNRDLMVSLSFRILEVKNVEKLKQKVSFSPP